MCLAHSESVEPDRRLADAPSAGRFRRYHSAKR